MDKETKTGIGFFGLLQLLFIALKLTKCVDWPWFWVLSPVIFEAAFVALIILIIVIGLVIERLKK